MKKGLLVVVVVSTLAYAGLALSGSWSVELDMLPSVALSSSSLTLAGELSGWTISGTGDWLGSDGWVWQELSVTGELFEFATLSWELLFGPLAPAFLYSLGTVEFSYGDAEFTVYSAMVGPNVPGYFFSGGPSGGMVIVAERAVGDIAFSSVTGIGAQLTDFTIIYTGAGTYSKVYPVDPFPGGFRFTYERLSVSGVPLCCGVTFDVTLAFSKDVGFESLEFEVKDVFSICCGISFDLGATFTSRGKSVRISPKLADLGQACLELYADLVTSGGEDSDLLLDAIRVDGWKIRCELGDCNYLEIVTFISLEHAGYYGYTEFEQGEFEYLKLGFCGPACCGGSYTFDLAAYFRPSGALFGLSRLTAALDLPVSEGFVFSLEFTGSPFGDPGLSLGWTLSF